MKKEPTPRQVKIVEHFIKNETKRQLAEAESEIKIQRPVKIFKIGSNDLQFKSDGVVINNKIKFTDADAKKLAGLITRILGG